MKVRNKTFGSRLVTGKGTNFSVWAPFANRVELKIVSPDKKKVTLDLQKEGYHSLFIPDLKEEVDYFYVLDDANELPDPASKWQPQGVNGPSRTLDQDLFPWTDQSWKGIALQEYIIYELHVGTFTSRGTFKEVISKLPYLRKLGVTAIELMPIASFPGDRNWGYDGVFPFSPQETYGGPFGLKELVNACHNQNIAVILDVVYNHFGPEGCVMSYYGPYLTDHYKTPWGKAINFDGSGSAFVREYVIENALYWLTEYHIDCLRLDAVHAIFDSSSKHILQELQEAFHFQADRLGRKAWIIAESDLNDIHLIKPVSENGYGVDAQWNDEFHHALRTLLLKEKYGYLMDFGKMEHLKNAIEEGYVYSGGWSKYRQKYFGTSSKHLPGEKFVIFSQNHDQIANASKGSTLASLISGDKLKVSTCILMFCPNIPLLFMGQERGSKTPFYFFTSFQDKKLIDAVKEGRRREYQTLNIEEEFVDPQDLKTFENSKLEWDNPENEIFLLYQRLIQLRKEHPVLRDLRKDLTEVEIDERNHWISITRIDPRTPNRLKLLANMGNSPWEFEDADFDIILETNPGSPGVLAPWSASIFSINP